MTQVSEVPISKTLDPYGRNGLGNRVTVNVGDEGPRYGDESNLGNIVMTKTVKQSRHQLEP
jgi:hypothetical protein